MSEHKPSYLNLPDPMKPVAVVRMLEIKARASGIDYKGSSFEEVMQATQKLEEGISSEDLGKRIKVADDWVFFSYNPDLKNNRTLYSFNDSVRSKEELDHLLELHGLLETEDRKVKLKVEI